MAIHTKNLWAETSQIASNSLKQLLVPEADAWHLTGSDPHELTLEGPAGSWPAHRGSLSTADSLTACLPQLPGPKEAVRWVGTRATTGPQAVLDSWQGALKMVLPEESALRRAQVGALHAIVGYQTSRLAEPGLVVMPTGTGKTETMLAWMVATRPAKVLVVVPSVALRDQLGSRFLTLGILQQLGVVAPHALRPCVALIDHGIANPADAVGLAAASNIVVTTPHALQAFSPAAHEALLSSMSHLIVDEAHHAPAPMWQTIMAAFEGRPILLFTATPYRSDGRTLPGRMIYRYPLREAQRDGAFSPFDFAMVPILEDDDVTLAATALTRLQDDLAAGLDHVLLARVNNKARSEEVAHIYRHLAPTANAQFLHDGLTAKRHKSVLADLREGRCRVVVCVDMLGEGFDLPTLKIAAIHNPRRSLSPMVQLIGRMARTTARAPIGRASVYVKQELYHGHSPLRDLLREDADWNGLLNDVTEYATSRAEQLSEFNSSFGTTPSNVPVALLQPKMSAVAFVASGAEWHPDGARTIYEDRILDDVVSVSATDNLAWFVVETVTEARWGRVPDLQSVNYDLVILYFDPDLQILFIHGSDTKRKYHDLAQAVLGGEPTQIRGLSTFRVFANLDRIVPTNVGLLDSRDRDKRFSMHVGASVLDALTEAEKQHKSNTHVAASALDNGTRISINAAMSGRFWSMETAAGLAEWREWCDRQAAKLTDSSISAHLLFKDMLIPEAVTERPPHPLLAVEWPWELYLGGGTPLRATYDGSTHSLLDISFAVDDYSDAGPFRFSLVSANWRCAYIGTVDEHGIHYAPRAADVSVEGPRGDALPLVAWLNEHKLTLLLAGDRLISGDDRLYQPRTDLAPYDRAKLRVLPWEGVDITVESQGVDRRPDSIQAYMSQHLQTNYNLDLLIDDDRAGEAADLVGLAIDGDHLVVILTHCKYSSGSVAGHRLKDLYEVCGQTIRGARWRDHNAEPLLAHLAKRVKSRLNSGHDPFDVGDIEGLHRLRERARFLRPRFINIVAQPGLSISESTDEQMRLLAGAESYVRAVTKGTFEVYGSK